MQQGITLRRSGTALVGFVAAWRASIVSGWTVAVAIVGLVVLNVTGDQRVINLVGLAILSVPMSRLGSAIFRGERADARALGSSPVPAWQDAVA